MIAASRVSVLLLSMAVLVVTAPPVLFGQADEQDEAIYSHEPPPGPALDWESSGTTPDESSVVTSRAVQPGEIRGVVFDAESGRPITSAVVWAATESVYTDSLGLFTLTAPDNAEFVAAEFVTFELVRLQLPPAERRAGRVARFALHSIPVDAQCEGPSPLGIRLEVRDGLTGRAPRGMVVLRARQDSLWAWDFKESSPADGSLFLSPRFVVSGLASPVRWDAPVQIEVVAAEYKPWFRGGVQLSVERCEEALIETIPVWLLPTEEVDGRATRGGYWHFGSLEEQESDLVGSDAVPDGEIWGIVFDATTGDPVKGAQVLFADRGALADSTGHFVLSDLPEGAHQLRAQFIGYREAVLPLRLRKPFSGLAARLAIHPAGVTRACEAFGAFGVRVTVHDALTGRAPTGPVALRIRQGKTTGWSFTAQAGGDVLKIHANLGPFTLGLETGSAVPIDAEVSAPGYLLWRRIGIRLPLKACGGGSTEEIPVWLLRTEPDTSLAPSNKR